MAQISSYPLLTPQLGDSILGSNTVDSTGNPVIGNPTVQYSISSVKSIVSQNFVQQLYSSSVIPITPPQDNTGASIKFGATDTGSPLTDSVYYTAATNSFTFRTLGTYYIQLAYNTRGNGGTEPKFAFITKDSAGAQVGPTVLDQTYRQNTTQNNKIINIEIMLNITTTSSVYTFHAAQEGIASGTLVVDAIAAGWTSVPSAGITISKSV